jgi:KUP system potassium uptake protein
MWRMILRYGFSEDPNVPIALRTVHLDGQRIRPFEVSYFLGRERLIPSKRPGGMALWREKLFILMSRNATGATRYFRIPTGQVVELGAQLKI